MDTCEGNPDYTAGTADRLWASEVLRSRVAGLLARHHARALRFGGSSEGDGRLGRRCGRPAVPAADTLKGIGIEALTSKILCKRHNNALSPLDTTAATLYRAVRTFDADLREDRPPPLAEVTVNGSDIERWMLKVLAGIAAATVLTHTSLRGNQPWLAALFGENAWPREWELSVVVDADPSYAWAGTEIRTLTANNEICGANFDLGGTVLRFTLGRAEGPLRRRPAGLTFMTPDRSTTRKLTFAWPRRPRTNYIEFTRTGQYDGPRPQDRGLGREP